MIDIAELRRLHGAATGQDVTFSSSGGSEYLGALLKAAPALLDAADRLARVEAVLASDEAVERVALAVLNSDRIAAGLMPQPNRDNIPDSDGYVTNARAAIAALAQMVGEG